MGVPFHHDKWSPRNWNRLICFSCFLFAEAALPVTASDAIDCSGNDPATAIKGCTALIERGSKDFATFLSRGKAYLVTHELDLAEADATEAVRLQPDHWLPYFLRCGILIGQSKLADAVLDCTRAIDRNASSGEAYGLRGMAYATLNLYETALPDLDQAVKLGFLGFESDELLAVRAEARCRMRQFDKGIAEMDAAIKSKPDYAFAYAVRANCYLFRRQHSKALVDIDKAIALEPEQAEYYMTRSAAFLQLSKFDRVISDCNMVIKLNPNHAAAYVNRGTAYMSMKKHARAMKDFDAAVKLNPSIPDIYNSRGIIYYEKAQYDRAVREYSKAIEINPQFPEAYVNRGNAQIERGKLKLAMADYDKAIEVDPSMLIAYVNRGKLFGLRGNRSKAIADFRKVLEIDPGNKDAKQALKGLGVKP